MLSKAVKTSNHMVEFVTVRPVAKQVEFCTTVVITIFVEAGHAIREAYRHSPGFPRFPWRFRF